MFEFHFSEGKPMFSTSNAGRARGLSQDPGCAGPAQGEAAHPSRRRSMAQAWRQVQRGLRLCLCSALACGPAVVWAQGGPGMVQGAGAGAAPPAPTATPAPTPAPMSAPAAGGASAAELALQGVWIWDYQPTEGGPLQRFLLERRADGSFTMVSRSYTAGRATSQLVNAGLWGVSNGLYFTVTVQVDGQRVNMRDSALYNPYVIVGLQGEELRYVHLPTGIELRTRKVPATTRLPD